MLLQKFIKFFDKRPFLYLPKDDCKILQPTFYKVDYYGTYIKCKAKKGSMLFDPIHLDIGDLAAIKTDGGNHKYYIGVCRSCYWECESDYKHWFHYDIELYMMVPRDQVGQKINAVDFNLTVECFPDNKKDQKLLIASIKDALKKYEITNKYKVIPLKGETCYQKYDGE